jgi:hypothetical protein
MTNEEVAKRVTRGSTTKWDKVDVLYNDGTWVLIKWPGCSYEQVSPWVEQYPIDKLENRSVRTTVWDSSVNGRLTMKRLAKLILSLNLDPQHVQGVIARSRPKPKTDVAIRPPKECKVKLETCAVKVCLFVHGVDCWMGEDCEEALETAKIVAEIDETGQQANGEYVVLMYNNVSDCMEFIKHDREVLLDTLESLT